MSDTIKSLREKLKRVTTRAEVYIRETASLLEKLEEEREKNARIRQLLAGVTDLAYHDEEIAVEPGEVNVASCGGCGESAVRERGRWVCDGHKVTPRGACIVEAAEAATSDTIPPQPPPPESKS